MQCREPPYPKSPPGRIECSSDWRILVQMRLPFPAASTPAHTIETAAWRRLHRQVLCALDRCRIPRRDTRLEEACRVLVLSHRQHSTIQYRPRWLLKKQGSV